MGIRLEDIRPLKASPVFRGISQKDRFELLKEIDARIVELDEGQLLRRAGDKLDFYPVVIEGSVLATMPQGGQDRPVAQFGPGESFAEAVPATLKHTPVNICAQNPRASCAFPPSSWRRARTRMRFWCARTCRRRCRRRSAC